ncbi:predicted protein [Botrytis cinerea T4]|uniref:Uncharacterized protein n=1 Tax=Botryotinia fuckeliana (strain T4) TaxID=999810 RepID=G2YJ90_BOTF4|nr:predicted protein [Botrytis cinerea T4]
MATLESNTAEYVNDAGVLSPHHDSKILSLEASAHIHSLNTPVLSGTTGLKEAKRQETRAEVEGLTFICRSAWPVLRRVTQNKT